MQALKQAVIEGGCSGALVGVIGGVLLPHITPCFFLKLPLPEETLSKLFALNFFFALKEGTLAEMQELFCNASYLGTSPLIRNFPLHWIACVTSTVFLASTIWSAASGSNIILKKIFD